MPYSKDKAGPALEVLQHWLRTRKTTFMFTTGQAIGETGLGRSRTSTYLGWLTEDDKSGVTRVTKTGMFRYDPEYDEGLINKDSGGSPLTAMAKAGGAPAHSGRTTVVRHAVAGAVARTLYENPGTVFDSAKMAEVTGHNRSSCLSAMKRIWTQEDSHITQLVPGVYVRDLATAEAISEPPSVPAIPVPTQPHLRQQLGAQEVLAGDVTEPEQLQPGDPLEVIGSGASGMVLVKSLSGQVFKLEEL